MFTPLTELRWVANSSSTVPWLATCSLALFNAVRYNYGDVEGCTLVVDIGARTTNLLFLEQNKVFSRAIPIAGNAITQSAADRTACSRSCPRGEVRRVSRLLAAVA